MNTIDPSSLPDGLMEEVYHSDNRLVRYVHWQRLDTIIASIPTTTNLKILDAGCGEGHLLEKLNAKNNSHRYYGIDFADISIEESKKRCPSAEIKKMSLAQIDYEADFFDVVTCTEVLEHVKEYEIVLKELKRVVKKEGYLIITFPNEVLWTLSRFLLGRKPIIDL